MHCGQCIVGRRYASGKGAQLADTLNLLKTAFPQHQKHQKQIEEGLRQALSIELYQRQRTARKDAPLFLLHDGPPFANGTLHLGHALNKILKDTTLRHKIQQGYRIEFRPGWDCHGLPIEQKAQAKLDGNRDRPTPMDIRRTCQKFAEQAIERQKSDMLKWGLLADYENPVRTMDPTYEATQLAIFADFVRKGLVFCAKRPVHWSPSSRTALAEAELEYNDTHVSVATFVRFRLASQSLSDPLYLLIWTTTPWTLPANQAIAYNPALRYVVIKIDGELYVVAEDCQSFLKAIEKRCEIHTLLSSEELLKGAFYHDLLDPSLRHPILPADFVEASVGTGLVHMAPAYGRDDYDLCFRHGIEAKEIVNEAGLFTDAAPAEVVGKSVIQDGSQAVIEMLTPLGAVIYSYPHEHSYPHDWRTKKPIIQRMTRQWYINIEQITDQIIAALEGIEFEPPSGKARLANMIKERKEWCISRQRSWGVPLPIFYGKSDGRPLLDPTIIEHVAGIFARLGSDAWWTLEVEDLLAPSMRHLASELTKGMDTLDVWFNSGTFWHITPDQSANIYIEGTDQYRGWFQSSLITSVVGRGHSPFKRLISHGFLLDETGKKMSKSLGNVTPPEALIEKPGGVDLLRLWACSANYTNDVQVGPKTITQVADVLQKIRNTFRFILGNIHDLGQDDFQEGASLPTPLDQYMTHVSAQLRQRVEIEHYNQQHFYKGIALIQKFLFEDLSNFYFEAIKNRLYLEPMDAPARRGAQMALLHIYRDLEYLLSPILPFLVQEVRSHLAPLLLQINLDKIPMHDEHLSAVSVMREWRSSIREHVNRLKAASVIASEYQTEIHLEPANVASKSFVERYLDDLCELFMTSKIVLVQNPHQTSHSPLATVNVSFDTLCCQAIIYRSTQDKCPRCWIYRADSPESLCIACEKSLQTRTKQNMHKVLAN